MEVTGKVQPVPGQGLTAGMILNSAMGPHGAHLLVLVDEADRAANSIFDIVSTQRGTNLGGETVRDRITMTGEEIEALYKEYQKQEPKGSFLDQPEKMRWCENCQRVLEEVIWPYTGDSVEAWNPETKQYERANDRGNEAAPGGEVCPECYGEAVLAEPEAIEDWELQTKQGASP